MKPVLKGKNILRGNKFKISKWPWPFLTTKSIGLRITGKTCVKYQHCRSNDNRVIVRKFCKVDLDLLTQNQEILLRSWSTHVWSIIIVCQKVMELSCGNCTNFKVKIWPFDPKINRGLPPVMVNTHVKYHHCMSKGNGVMVQKPLFHRRTDRPPWWNQYTPTTSLVGGGGIIIIMM